MIDTQAIRSKILDLAMRGKLTEQLPEDGTAEGLVATSANPKTTRMLATPFEIPNSWRWTSVEKLTTPIGKKSDQIYANDVKNTGKYPAVSQGEQFIDGYTDEEKAIVDLPVIIFGDHTKNVKFVDFPFVICADGTKCLKVSSLNDPKFVFFWMKYASGAIEDRGYARHYSLLKKYPVSLPPLAEQHRIVARIEQAFAALDTIDALQAKYADNLAVLKSKLIDAAIRGKLTDQLPEDGTAEDLYRQIQTEKQALVKSGKIKKEKPLPEIAEDKEDFDIPENWRWVSVGNVCTNIQYGSSKKSSSFGKMAVLRMGNIQAGKIVYDDLVYTSDDDEIQKHPLEKDDLLFNRTNSMELVGKTAIYKGEMPAIYAGYLVRLTPLAMVSEYLNYVMQSKYYWDYCRTVRIDSNGQSNINAEKLKRFVFPLPPLAEQKRIVKQLDTVLTIVGA